MESEEKRLCERPVLLLSSGPQTQQKPLSSVGGTANRQLSLGAEIKRPFLKLDLGPAVWNMLILTGGNERRKTAFCPKSQTDKHIFTVQISGFQDSEDLISLILFLSERQKPSGRLGRADLSTNSCDHTGAPGAQSPGLTKTEGTKKACYIILKMRGEHGDGHQVCGVRKFKSRHNSVSGAL